MKQAHQSPRPFPFLFLLIRNLNLRLLQQSAQQQRPPNQLHRMMDCWAEAAMLSFRFRKVQQPILPAHNQPQPLLVLPLALLRTGCFPLSEEASLRPRQFLSAPFLWFRCHSVLRRNRLRRMRPQANLRSVRRELPGQHPGLRRKRSHQNPSRPLSLSANQRLTLAPPDRVSCRRQHQRQNQRQT